MLLEVVHEDIEDVGYHKSHDKGLHSAQHQGYEVCQYVEILAYNAYCYCQCRDKDIFFYVVFVHSEPKKRQALQSYIMSFKV